MNNIVRKFEKFIMAKFDTIFQFYPKKFDIF